eukprot:c11554_g1_i1.p1 GENE.c11554_g1_i1~~c11554_g1_i1.p1  ORF type:complete len:535 (+),score=91.72 c11554_g1_i1:1-1605(+)
MGTSVRVDSASVDKSTANQHDMNGTESTPSPLSAQPPPNINVSSTIISVESQSVPSVALKAEDTFQSTLNTAQPVSATTTTLPPTPSLMSFLEMNQENASAGHDDTARESVQPVPRDPRDPRYKARAELSTTTNTSVTPVPAPTPAPTHVPSVPVTSVPASPPIHISSTTSATPSYSPSVPPFSSPLPVNYHSLTSASPSTPTSPHQLKFETSPPSPSPNGPASSISPVKRSQQRESFPPDSPAFDGDDAVLALVLNSTLSRFSRPHQLANSPLFKLPNALTPIVHVPPNPQPPLPTASPDPEHQLVDMDVDGVSDLSGDTVVDEKDNISSPSPSSPSMDESETSAVSSTPDNRLTSPISLKGQPPLTPLPNIPYRHNRPRGFRYDRRPGGGGARPRRWEDAFGEGPNRPRSVSPYRDDLSPRSRSLPSPHYDIGNQRPPPPPPPPPPRPYKPHPGKDREHDRDRRFSESQRWPPNRHNDEWIARQHALPRYDGRQQPSSPRDVPLHPLPPHSPHQSDRTFPPASPRKHFPNVK